MESVGVFEAKTHFSEIVEKVVQRGVEYTITRHGKPIARIVPFNGRTPEQQARVGKALADLKRFAKGRSLGGISVRELIDEGRKY